MHTLTTQLYDQDRFIKVNFVGTTDDRRKHSLVYERLYGEDDSIVYP